MRRIFKTKSFARWMRKSSVSDAALVRAVDEMVAGLFDADLGGGIFKKRLPVAGKGKRGGARTILATNRADRWFFLFGFNKSERSNITQQELDIARTIAEVLLTSSDAYIQELPQSGQWLEVDHAKET